MSEQKSESPWIKVHFDEICKNISDRIDDPKQADTDYYVGLEHLDSDDLEIKRHGIPEDMSSSKFRFKSGQILFGRRRAYQRKLAIAKREGICSTDIMVLEHIEGKIVKDFLPLFMQSEEVYERILTHSAGSLSPRVKWTHLAEQEFWIPSKPEQIKIVEMIEEIDDVILKTNLILEKLKVYKNSKMNQVLTKGIGHTKFKKIKLFFGKYEEIPEDWHSSPMKELVLKMKSGGTPKSDEKSYYGGNIPFVTITDITESGKYLEKTIKKITDKGLKNSSAWLIPENSILFSMYATLGKIVITKIPTACHQGIMGIMPNPQKIGVPFLYYVLQLLQKKINTFALTGTQSNLNLEIINDIRIIYPSSIKEQQKIAFILSEIDNHIDEFTSHLSKLKEMRKSILNDKLTRKKQEEKILV